MWPLLLLGVFWLGALGPSTLLASWQKTWEGQARGLGDVANVGRVDGEKTKQTLPASQHLPTCQGYLHAFSRKLPNSSAGVWLHQTPDRRCPAMFVPPPPKVPPPMPVVAPYVSDADTRKRLWELQMRQHWKAIEGWEWFEGTWVWWC